MDRKNKNQMNQIHNNMLNNSVIKTKEKWKKRKRLQVKNLKSRSKCMHDTHITKEESTNTSQYGERRYGEEKQKIVVRLFCILHR